MRFGSVCSGIEAASVAWKPLGWSCAFMSEIEAFPRAVLKHHHPETPLHGDFTTIEPGDYEPIDLLVGGTPCQDFSVAGLRAGMAGDRGDLTLQFLTLARRLRPQWLVWENVPGVLSSNGGRDFGAFLGGLGELGYGWAYRTLDAQFFGVAQRRRRVFVVGHAGDWRRAAAVLFERHSLQGHPAPSRETRQGTPSATAPCLDASFGRLQGCSGQDANHGHGHLITFGWQNSESQGDSVSEHVTPTLDKSKTPAIAFALRGREGGAMPEVGGDQVGSLRAASGGSSRDYVAFGVTIHGTDGTASAASMTDVAGAIRTSQPGRVENSGTTAALHGSAVRRLTPRECERLQGFEDDYTLIPWRKGMAPDGPRYKALGNSMAVPVMSWIGRRIAAVEALGVMAEAA